MYATKKVFKSVHSRHSAQAWPRQELGSEWVVPLIDVIAKIRHRVNTGLEQKSGHPLLFIFKDMGVLTFLDFSLTYLGLLMASRDVVTH